MDSFKVEIPISRILLTLSVIVGIILAWQLREVLFIVFAAFILNSSLRPFVDNLDKRGIPRLISTLAIYLLAFMVVGAIAVTILRLAASQMILLVAELPEILARVYEQLAAAFPWAFSTLNIPDFETSIAALFRALSENFFSGGLSGALSFVKDVFSGGLGIISIIVISIYMLKRRTNFYEGMMVLVEEEKRHTYTRLLDKIQYQLGAWVRGQLVLMLLVGLFTWIALMLPALFVPDYKLDSYALPIALLAGLLEAIPNIGPILTTIVAVILAVGSSPLFIVVYVILSFVIIQQAENIFLAPTVMKKALGIDAVISIIGIIAALKLFGVIGAIVVIPTIAVGQIIIEFWLEERKNKEY